MFGSIIANLNEMDSSDIRCLSHLPPDRLPQTYEQYGEDIKSHKLQELITEAPITYFRFSVVTTGQCHLCSHPFVSRDHCAQMVLPGHENDHPVPIIYYCRFQPSCYFGALKSVAYQLDALGEYPLCKFSNILSKSLNIRRSNGSIESDWSASPLLLTANNSINVRVLDKTQHIVKHISLRDLFAWNPSLNPSDFRFLNIRFREPLRNVLDLVQSEWTIGNDQNNTKTL